MCQIGVFLITFIYENLFLNYVIIQHVYKTHTFHQNHYQLNQNDIKETQIFKIQHSYQQSTITK